MTLYAITGHTSGIGHAIYNRLSPSIIGFSRSTGYDITKKSDRSRIISESQNCNVFINNATDGFGQVELLIELFESWKDSNKTIINVGSRIAEITLSPAYINLISYAAQKKLLNLSYQIYNITYATLNTNGLGMLVLTKFSKNIPILHQKTTSVSTMQ